MAMNRMMELIIGLVIVSFVLSIFLPTISTNFASNVFSNTTNWPAGDKTNGTYYWAGSPGDSAPDSLITQTEYLIYSNFGVFIALILLIAILAIGGLYKYGKK